MRISDNAERAFYESHAAEGHWSLRQLSRQIGSQLYERSLKHPEEADVRALMRKAPKPEAAVEPLKDPYMLEFLVRFTFEEQHYKVDLVFYNRRTRSFFVFDLKLAKITHQDLGQMQMYVHYYDRIVKLPDENPTIGILLNFYKLSPK